MITRAQDYLYTTPLAAGIHGKILPNVAGTGEACVDRYEDVVYLVEMARERAKWEYGSTYDPTQYVLPNFDPASIGADRATIAGLCDYAHNAPNGYVIDINSRMIPSTWSDANTYPIVVYAGDADGWAWVTWRKTIPALALTCPTAANVPRISDTDTIAKLFADFSGMKRWLFLAGDKVNETDFANGQGHSYSSGGICHTSYMVQVGNASGTMVGSHPEYAHYPSWGWDRSYYDGASHYDEGNIYCTLRVYIKKGFVYDRLTGSSCLGTTRLYANWHFDYLQFRQRGAASYTNKGGTTVVTAHLFDVGSALTACTGALAEEYDAYFDIPLFAGAGLQTVAGQIKSAAIAKYAAEGFADDADHEWFAQVHLTHLIIDTGVVTHVARIES